MPIDFKGGVAQDRMHDGTAADALNAGTGTFRMVLATATGQYTIYSSTYNSVALSYFSEINGGGGWESIHRLLNPASGINTFYTGMDAQGNQTCIGTAYGGVDPTTPLVSHVQAATLHTQPSVDVGQWIVAFCHHGYTDAKYIVSDAGTMIHRVTSYSTPADDQHLRLYTSDDSFDPTGVVIRAHTETHTVWVGSVLINPIAIGGNQMTWIHAMMKRWQQFMDELRTPSNVYGYGWLPSRLRWDMDRYVVHKRYRELCLDKWQH